MPNKQTYKKIMPFGEYKGRPIETIAITNYPYFFEFLKNLKTKDTNSALAFAELYLKLNDFKPKSGCRHQENNNTCQNTPDFLSFSLDPGGQITSGYDIYCQKHGLEIPNRKRLPLDYNSLLNFKNKGKGVQKKTLENILSQQIGFEIGKRKTDNYIAETLEKATFKTFDSEEINNLKTIIANHLARDKNRRESYAYKCDFENLIKDKFDKSKYQRISEILSPLLDFEIDLSKTPITKNTITKTNPQTQLTLF